MTKLDLEICVDDQELRCRTNCETTASILGMDVGHRSIPVAEIMADAEEVATLQSAVDQLILKYKDQEDSGGCGCSETLNLVLSAPGVRPSQDRSPIDDVFANPVRAIHVCGELQLACFVHLELRKQDGNPSLVSFTGLEYSRSHRKKYLRQEFGSWLLEDNIEKSVIATTVEGKICYWNRFASELFQYSREEALGQNIMELGHTGITQELGVEIFAKLSKGEHWKGMFHTQRKDGTTFMAHVTDSPILDVNGGVKFVVGVSADYSQLHDVMDRLEVLNSHLEREVQARTKQLLERESVLRRVGAAVQESDTAVLISNEECIIIWANNTVFKMLAVDQYSVLGALPWSLPLEPEKCTRRRTENNDGFRTLESFFKNIMVRCNNDKQNAATVASTTATVLVASMTATVLIGEGCTERATKSVADVVSVTVQRLVSSSPAENGEGSKDEYMITLRDITADRVAERALLLAENAAATSSAKTDMMRMLSHELRTPLQGIMGVASTLLVDIPPEEAIFDSLSMILASSRLLLTLINNVLDIGKMDSKILNAIELDAVPVLMALRDGIKFCEPLATINNIRLVLVDKRDSNDKTSVRMDPIYVMGNRMRLEQIMVNLTSNSIKYTTPGTCIEISSRCCSARQALDEACAAAGSDLTFLTAEQVCNLDDSVDVCVISVRDYGIGIPPAEFGKVFGEYSQLMVSHEKDRNYVGGQGGQSSGSGLGLNLTLKFVRMMNGHIWFDNCKSGGGVIFSFCIPTCNAPVESAARYDEISSENEEMDPTEAARFRVLVVDDNLINSKVLTRILKRIGVMEIETAGNGLEALNAMLKPTKFTPNLLLVDLQMPVMDGYELVLNLIARKLKTNRLVVACSADWAPETEEKCLEHGFDRLLRKPITFSDIKLFLVRAMRENREIFL